jgi:ubiquinone/menaquinone biosynthesis C-methylase UbiE
MTTTNPSSTYFEKVATQWDDLRTGYFTEAVREAAIAKAYLHPTMTVADIGAGTGFMSAGLAPLVSRVHVLDGSAAMLEVARKNLAQFANVEFQLADGLALPLPHASLDAAFANMYLHHCPKPLAAIREMLRTLRPGGRLVITDMDTHTHTWLKDEMADLWLGFDRDQIRRWFEQAGLVNVVIEGTGQSCQAECAEDESVRAQISIFVATGTKCIDVRASVQASYAAKALSAGCGCADDCCSDPAVASTDCCAPGCCSPGLVSLDELVSGSVNFDGGYSLAETGAIPAEAAEISLGCGNPTALANLREGEAVLDIGSGGGIDAFLAAKKVGPQGSVIGVDMTPAMLQRARKVAKKGGYDNVKFRHGYAEKLPVEDATIDVIISNCVINLTEDKGKVFRESFRALKNGGRLEVSDMVFGGALPVSGRTSVSGWSECVSGALPEQEYVDLVAQAGFKDISVRRSASAGTALGVPVYSVQLSAKKE